MAANGKNYRKSDQTKDWIGYAVAEVLDLDPSDEADKRQIKAILKKWFANGVLDTKERLDEKRMPRPFACRATGTKNRPMGHRRQKIRFATP
jgi:hypothetical protein